MPQEPMRKKSKDDMHLDPDTKRFARYFNYVPQDLLFNRRGYMSPRQTKELRNNFIGSLIYRLFIIFSLLIFIGYQTQAPAFARTQDEFFGYLRSARPLELMFSFSIIGLVVLFILLIREILLHRDDIRSAKVIPLIGPANRRSKEFKGRAKQRRSNEYYIEIMGHEYEVGDEIFKLCQKNLIYCAYLSKATNQIISMEVVNDSIHDMPDWMQEAYEKFDDRDFAPISKSQSRMI